MRSILTVLFGLLIFWGAYKIFVAPPSNFPVPYHLTVSNGESLAAISHQLVNDHVIRSNRAFEVAMLVFGSDKDISQGEYYFTQPVSSLIMALRISGKEYGIEKVRVTFPEGYTTAQMTIRLKAVFPLFNTAEFMAMTSGDQGYLFPDTYRFFPTPLPSEVVTAMKNNYAEKIGPLEKDIAASGHSEHDIIVMASLLEKEAKGATDSPVIAGILWKRIANGMDLQVDADTWTYSHKGLPDTAVDNPGLVAINAAIHPTASPYVYYLHDSMGNVHYASTFAQHEQNIKKYLDK